MKRFVLSALLAALLAGGVFAIDFYTPKIEISSAEVSPEPVEPGQDMLVKIKVSNSGNKAAENVSLLFPEGYPFKIKTISDPIRGRSLFSASSAETTYYLLVDPAAKSGVYPIEVKARYFVDSYQMEEKKTISIQVLGKPQVVFEAQGVENATPNSDFEIDFRFKNIGTGAARNLRMDVGSSDFVVLGSTQTLESLLPGESKNLAVRFYTTASVAPDTYAVPITLSYLNENGADVSGSQKLGVRVLNSAQLAVQNIKIDPAVIKKNNDITLVARIQNAGYGDAKEVVVELDSPLEGYKKAFLGELEKKEDAPVVFNLKATQSGKVDGILKITYRDDFGVHEKSEKLSVIVGSENGKTSIPESAYLAIGAVGILSLIYSFLRKK